MIKCKYEIADSAENEAKIEYSHQINSHVSDLEQFEDPAPEFEFFDNYSELDGNILEVLLEKSN